MKISRAEVEKVALLARLLLSEQELETMTSQLGAILEYVTCSRKPTPIRWSRFRILWNCATYFGRIRSAPAWIAKRPCATPHNTTASAIWSRRCWANC